MSKLEITIKYDELISVMTRLAEALENRPKEVQVTREVSTDAVEQEEEPISPEKTEEIEKPVTLEQIRAVLTAKSQAGKKVAIQGLFKRYEADKLTAVDPSRYGDLLKEAEEL